MEIDRKELKRQARERMALTDPKFWAVALVYIVMTTGASWLVSFLPLPEDGAVQLFFQLLLILYTTVVRFGLCLWALWAWRQLDPGAGSLTQGFSVAGRVLLMELGIYLRILGWYFCIALLLFIPVFAILLMADSRFAAVIISLLYAASLIATLIVLRLRYALVPYLLADRPDDRTSAHISRSAGLMRGWKGELFKLELSFIGWEAVNFVLSAAVYLFFLHQTGLLTLDALLIEGWQDQALNVFYSAPAVILSTLVTMPVNLRLLPYRAVARAGFYDARLQAVSQEAPPVPEMPPL